MRPYYQYILFAIISSILSSFSNIFKLIGLQTLPALLVAAVGVLIGGFLSFLVLLLSGKIPQISKIKLVAKPLFAIIASRSFLANIFFTIGLQHSSVIKATFLTKMEPYMVIFWVWLLDGIRPKGSHLLLLLVHIFGAFLLSSKDALTNPVIESGDLFILIAVICAGFSYRFVPKVSPVLAPMQTAALTETLGGLATLPLALILLPISTETFLNPGWFYIALHALMFYTIAMTLLYASLGGIPGWLTSALRATGPVVVAPIAWIFLGERLTNTQIFGAFLVLLTSAMISRAEKKN